MKKPIRIFICCLLAMIMLTSTVCAASFPDVADDADYAEAVEYLRDIGLMVGDDKGNFNPDKTVTRAEMATIVCRMMGETENLRTGKDFSDVPLEHWANAYINKAAELGIVNGYGGGLFGPEDTVTYEQALTMIIRAIGLEEIALEYGGYPNGYVEVACEFGLSNWLSAEIGDTLVRWQVARILYNTSL